MIAMIGSGSWGTAVASMLANKGEEVTLWSYFPEESQRLQADKENKEFLPGVKLDKIARFTSSLEEAVEGADLIVTAVPSHVVRATLHNLSPFIKEGQDMVNIAKGLEPGTLKRLSEIFEEEIPQANLAVMSGPSHAEEVGKGNIPTTNVVASADPALAKKVQETFATPYFRVYTGTDMIGVELGGALKNVIALCAGVTDGLGFGDNTKAALMTRGLAEMTRLGVAMGAKAATFGGLSGVGDMIVTCCSMHSRNRRFGILVGQGVPIPEAKEKVHMVVEGINACEAAYGLAKKYHIDMPIVTQAYGVLFEGKSAKDVVKNLMNREQKPEVDLTE